jgi:hypothetical protein
VKLVEALFLGQEEARQEVQKLNPDRGPGNFKLTVNGEAWMEMMQNIPYLQMYVGDRNKLYDVDFEIVSRQKEKYLLSWDIGYELSHFVGRGDNTPPKPVPFDSLLPRSKELIVEW